MRLLFLQDRGGKMERSTACADVRYVQELLGHAQLDSTMRYTCVAVADFARVIARSHPREREWTRRGRRTQ